MIKIKDISIKCGVSVSTVSKALNGQSDISEEKANYIRSVARDMGYLPNAAARALKTNRSYNIGVLFVDKTQSGLKHEFFSEILNSLKEEAERLGYDITFTSSNIGNFKMSYYEHVKYRNCDGVVIASVDFTNSDVIRLVESEVPTVTIDHVFSNSTAIMSDNIISIKEIVEYVYGQGHRKIAFIHGEDTSVTQKRLASFYRVCSELNVEIPDEYIKTAIYHDPRATNLATKELLKLPNRPTCILFPDDYSAMGGLTEIESQGLVIPKDISVVGYDGIYLSRVLRPKLTTYKQDADAMGRKAVAKLIERIESPKTFIPEQIMVYGKLQVGDTVKNLLT